MTSDRWARIAAIYESVIERPSDDCRRFLLDACAGDDELRREVESLLAQDVSRDGPIERVAVDAASASVLPATIGGYRVLRLIGEGGMGAVYEAEQDHPRRIVALKVVKSGFAAPALLRRFAQETEALGRLQHDGIARIYDAGTTETPWGPQPYFAMELIRGLPLLDYANQRSLSPTKRIELMIRICEAVAHAHQRGIVHRDLKPGNILVDESGQPKVLDFGVARVADYDAGTTRQTNVGDLVGTLAYMSPEQVLADPTMIDGRSDVYSLGVMLYELLAARLPYRVENQLTEAIRAVREDDPAPLGTINRTYRGDLEVIVAKALEKEASRRYGSPAELGDDLRRYLANQPILAVPPTATYQARKFIRRHRSLVGAALSIFVVLVAGIAVSTRQAILASRERDRALRAEQIAKAVSDFLQKDVLAQASAAGQAGGSADPDPDLKVRTALDRAAARISGKFDSQPAVEASIRDTIGRAYIDLGLYADAQRQLERTVDLRTRVLGTADPETLGAIDRLADAYAFQTKYARAEALLRNGFETAKRSLGPEAPATLALMSDLALLTGSKGNYAESTALLSQLLVIERRLKGDEDVDTLEAMGNLATEYDNMGRYSDAEPLRIRQIEASVRVRGPNHPETLTAINNLGVLYRKEGKYTESETQLKTALERRLKVYGDGHHSVLASMNSLSLLYQAEGRYAEAEPLVRQVLTTARKSLGERHADTLRYLNNLADLYRKEGKTSEAEAAFAQLVDDRRRLLGSDHPNTSKALTSLGEMKLEKHAYAEAERLLREAVQGREKKNPDSWERYYAEALLGESLAGQGRKAEATALLESGYKGLVARQTSIPAENRAAIDQIRLRVADITDTNRR
jgi:serine/threonine protein kinase